MYGLVLLISWAPFVGCPAKYTLLGNANHDRWPYGRCWGILQKVDFSLDEYTRGGSFAMQFNQPQETIRLVKTETIDKHDDGVCRGDLLALINDLWEGDSVGYAISRKSLKTESEQARFRIIEMDERPVKYRIASYPISKILVPAPFHVNNHVVNVFVDLSHQQRGSFVRCSIPGLGFQNCPNVIPEIQPQISSSRRAIEPEQNTGCTSQFADLFHCFDLRLGIGMRSVAVRSNNNPMFRSDHNEGSSKQAWVSHHKEGNQEVPEHHALRFLRQNDRRYSAGYLDPKTDQYVSMVEENDFDASYDGKKWFHLLGRVCLRGLKLK
jgi:hypothetical protein